MVLERDVSARGKALGFTPEVYKNEKSHDRSEFDPRVQRDVVYTTRIVQRVGVWQVNLEHHSFGTMFVRKGQVS